MDYATILQHQTTSIVLLDDRLCVVYLNEAAEALFTASVKQSVGQAFQTIAGHDESLISACNSVISRGVDLRLRHHRLSLPGSTQDKQIACTISRIDTGQDVDVMLEMSEIESVSAALRDEEFLSRQQSNQAVIRGLAHEIRNPLGGIRGAAQLLAQEVSSGTLDDYARVIMREADRLTALVDRMQARTSVKLDQAVNIHRLLEHVRQLVLADDSRLLTIIQDYDPSLPPVRGNGDLLIQALLNVLRNAVEAVREGFRDGEIVIRSRIDRLAIDGRQRQVVRVDIIDNGPGVSPDIEQRMFDPMVTSKQNGTGLGLPITAEIVAQHNGSLDCTSRPGETVFRLFLPVAEKHLKRNRSPFELVEAVA